jgi:hypothetical protein
MKWMASGVALLFSLAPLGIATADDVDNMDGTQLSDTAVIASENALEGSGSQASLVGASANTGSGSQTNLNNDSSSWEFIANANAGSGAQFADSENSNGGNRDSQDVLIGVGGNAAVSNSDLGASVSGNSVDAQGGSADSGLGISGEGSGFSGLYGVNAVAASAGSNSSQNVSVNVGAEVMAY